MDQLQYMPLAADPPGASNSGNGSTSSSGDGARQLVHAKRVRMGTNAKPPTGSPVKSPALTGLPPANRALDHLHASLGGLVVGPGGLGGSSSSSPGGQGSPIIMGSPPSSSPGGGGGVMGRGMAASNWRGGQALGSLMCPYRMNAAAAGGEGGRLDPRHDSLNAIMQSTVVETLGFQ